MLSPAKRLVFVLLVISLPVPSNAEDNATKPATLQGTQIHVTNHGWHTGFIFPRAQLVEKVPALNERFPIGKYLEVGWGDEGFYQASEITTGLVLSALFWSTDSVVHVVSVPDSPYLSFPGSETLTLCLSDTQLDRLVEYLGSSFARNQSGSVMPQKTGIYGNSQFYTGQGQYHLFNTCNTWIARGLNSAGYDINSALALTASSVMGYLDSLETAQASPQCD